MKRAQRAERRGRAPQARALYEAALHRLAEATDECDASNLLRWIARTHRSDADLDSTFECAEAALAVAEAHFDLGARGHATSLLGDIASIRGDELIAFAHYATSLAAYRDVGLLEDVGLVLNNLGVLHAQCGEWGQAAVAYDEAMRIALQLGDLAGQLAVEVHRADWNVMQGDVAGAWEACGRAMALAARTKDAPALGEAHKVCGVVERERGSHATAEMHLRRAQEIALARQDVLLLADATQELGELHRRQGRNREALQCLNRAQCLFSQLRARRELADVSQRTGRLEEDFLDVARRWGQSIECNDEYTQGHCERVADIACALAQADGMDEQSLFWFRIGALLHDVGKLGLPVEVLNKCGKLTPEEWALVRSHPTTGVAMLAEVEFPWDVRPIVESHHERWDGAGYPHGLAGEEIPRDARMVCIADVYDALTSERSYKEAMPHEMAMTVMRADAGRQFDPALFALFERVTDTVGRAWRRQPS